MLKQSNICAAVAGMTAYLNELNPGSNVDTRPQDTYVPKQSPEILNYHHSAPPVAPPSRSLARKLPDSRANDGANDDSRPDDNSHAVRTACSAIRHSPLATRHSPLATRHIATHDA